MTPHQKLLKNEELLKLILEHQYVPQVSQSNFNEMLGALREIDPAGKYDPACSGCVMEIAKMANIHLQAYKKSVFHTFPKHEKNKETTGDGKEKAPKTFGKSGRASKGSGSPDPGGV